MAWYVYILQSEKDGTFYKGSTENPKKRLEQHNAGLSQYTAHKMPWQLIYVEELSGKTEMLIREKKLKNGNAVYFIQLLASAKNIVSLFK